MNTSAQPVSPHRSFKAGLWAALAFVLLVLTGPLARATPFTPVDEKSVRAVVEAQLAAFAKDDAVKAFSFAAPNVREAVGTAADFLSMVRRSYPVVYRPASVAFLRPEAKEDEAVQRVQMTDASGASWLAVYSLVRTKDSKSKPSKSSHWLITGCVVVENKGRMT